MAHNITIDCPPDYAVLMAQGKLTTVMIDEIISSSPEVTELVTWEPEDIDVRADCIIISAYDDEIEERIIIVIQP